MLQRLCVILLSIAVCFSMPASAQTKKA
ncbi:MAG: hypothetical protein JWN45_2473, partial [Acidobacteriaceae bacterium]|nr:hypothetical protein [Acidobacteriaceae bacterium]